MHIRPLFLSLLAMASAVRETGNGAKRTTTETLFNQLNKGGMDMGKLAELAGRFMGADGQPDFGKLMRVAGVDPKLLSLANDPEIKKVLTTGDLGLLSEATLGKVMTTLGVSAKEQQAISGLMGEAQMCAESEDPVECALEVAAPRLGFEVAQFTPLRACLERGDLDGSLTAALALLPAELTSQAAFQTEVTTLRTLLSKLAACENDRQCVEEQMEEAFATLEERAVALVVEHIKESEIKLPAVSTVKQQLEMARTLLPQLNKKEIAPLVNKAMAVYQRIFKAVNPSNRSFSLDDELNSSTSIDDVIEMVSRVRISKSKKQPKKQKQMEVIMEESETETDIEIEA